MVFFFVFLINSLNNTYIKVKLEKGNPTFNSTKLRHTMKDTLPQFATFVEYRNSQSDFVFSFLRNALYSCGFIISYEMQQSDKSSKD